MTLTLAETAKALRVLAQLAHEVHSSLTDAATDLELLAAEAEDEAPEPSAAIPDETLRILARAGFVDPPSPPTHRPAAVSPDCAAGKCSACTGDGWDPIADRLTPCEHHCHHTP